MLPRVITSGREWLRNFCVRLPLCGVRLNGPLQVTALYAGQPTQWRVVEERCTRAMMVFEVDIPLTLCLCDACGATQQAQSLMCVCVGMRLQCARHECWRNTMVFQACVRLLESVRASQQEAEVRLEVCVEGYMVRMEPFGDMACKPPCPQLPLFPQPRC